ncbi:MULTISPECIES: asparagine synthase (glutamine-hydrolyzing) [unclassified Blastococcus]
MCGIVGLVDSAGLCTRESLRHHLGAMTAVVDHRGPDDAGVFVDPQVAVGLGHRRLAIVDLSPAGHQPMMSRDRRFVLAFNGMVYNHRLLRAELTAAGVPFRGHSDTEVLLEGWVRWGARGTLDRLNGMFALAVWDRRERTLTLARDRLGEKPLYWTHREGLLAFGSESRVLAEVPSVPRELDRDVLAEMLRFSFVPPGRSVWKDVRQLGAGEVLTLGYGDPEPTVETYWSISAAVTAGRSEPFRGSGTDLVDRTEELLRDAVRLRLESDVPLGTFLSGGVDSALVTALAAGAAPSLRTFTVAMEGDGDLDESQAAALVARRLGTEHTTIPLRSDDVLAAVQDVGRVYDEPFADPSAVAVLALSRATREFVTVALSGDGGDELFGGYNRYAAAERVLRLGRRFPPGVRTAAARAAARIPLRTWATAARVARLRDRWDVPQLAEKVHRAADVFGSRDLGEAWLRLASVWPEPPVLGTAARPPRPPRPDVRGLMQRDQEVTLPADMLTKVDRATMSVALEARVPLLDHRLVEWSWRLPTEALVRDGRGKWVLRQVLERHLPRSLVDRPKAGFDPPLGRWLRGPLRPWAEERLSPGALTASGLLDAGPVRQAWRDHLSGRADRTYRLWSVLVLQSWLAEQKGVLG